MIENKTLEKQMEYSQDFDSEFQDLMALNFTELPKTLYDQRVEIRERKGNFLEQFVLRSLIKFYDFGRGGCQRVEDIFEIGPFMTFSHISPSSS